MKSVIAIDLGASSGRVMVGYLHNGTIELDEIHRFTNSQVIHGNESCWDLYSILEEIKIGINKVAAKSIPVSSLGIDSWGVDFVLLDKFGKHLGEFVSYRDARTQGIQDKLVSDGFLNKEDIYGITGIQFLPFNTINQLKAIYDQKPAWFEDIDKLLFIPDYLNYKLCGVMHCEYTDASTSQLLNCHGKNWSEDLISACGAKLSWFIPPSMPNEIIGNYQLGNIQIPVCAVASHDTASAVAATPLFDDYTAYISSGTWSLVGIESTTAFTNKAAFQANLTNEGGVNGRYRVLKNIMGLWLIQRIKAENPSLSFPDVALLAQHAEPFKYIVNPNDDVFLNPDSMTNAIQSWFTSRDRAAPQSLSEIIRCIYDSLALAYQDALQQISQVTGRVINEIRIVGGGTQDLLLNQLCADVCELKVSTEPTEASALGNVINQFIALGIISDLNDARKIIHNSSNVKYFYPNKIERIDEIKQAYQLIK